MSLRQREKTEQSRTSAASLALLFRECREQKSAITIDLGTKAGQKQDRKTSHPLYPSLKLPGEKANPPSGRLRSRLPEEKQILRPSACALNYPGRKANPQITPSACAMNYPEEKQILRPSACALDYPEESQILRLPHHALITPEEKQILRHFRLRSKRFWRKANPPSFRRLEVCLQKESGIAPPSRSRLKLPKEEKQPSLTNAA